jgi:hypothetical protein
MLERVLRLLKGEVGGGKCKSPQQWREIYMEKSPMHENNEILLSCRALGLFSSMQLYKENE